MANTRSASKNSRKAEKRHAQRVQVKSELKTLRKNFLTSLEGKKVDQGKAKEALGQACKRFTQAASNGIIHRNTASRKIGRLMRRFHKASQAKA